MTIDRVRRSDDTGSAVAFLPILGLLFFAGIAALIGIALQASDSEAAPEPTVNASQLGAPCSDTVGPIPAVGAGAEAREAWSDAMGDCIEDRIEAAFGSEDDAERAGFVDVDESLSFEDRPTVLITWSKEPPAEVAAWAVRHPSGAVSVTVVRGEQ